MFYCIDFESTGAVNGQQPLEFAWVELDLEGNIGDYHEIGFNAVSGGRELGGIKDQVPKFLDCWPLLKEKLVGKVLAGHNVSYDYSLIVKSFPAFKNSGLVDSLTIYRQLYGSQLADYSLGSLLETFQLTSVLENLKLNDHFEAHRALYDAYGCALLLQRLLKDPVTAKLFKSNAQSNLL